MKNTKKVLALLLVLVMAIVALTGCGGGGDDKAGFTPDANSVLNTKVLRVGMECGYAPYNWTQNSDANGAVPIKDTKDFAYGYDVMMAKLIAEELGYELEIQRIDWDSLPVALQSGKLDCVIAGQSITAERLQTVDFSTPYYYADVVCLVKADGAYGAAQNVADLAGVKCTSQINTIWYDVLDQIADVDKLPPMETVPNMLVALDSGKVDLVCTDMPTAMAAVVAYPDMQIVDFAGGTGFEVSDEEVNIGISIQKGNAELVEQINGVLANLTEDDYVEMMKQAIAVQPLSE